MYNVLLVDDEPLMRDALKSMIEWRKYGFCLIGEACDGEEAIEIINNNQSIDIVITDIKMPVIDGIGLIQVIHPKRENIRFIVLSAFDEFNMVRNAFKAGAVEYILKSEMNPPELLNILQNVKTMIEQEKNKIEIGNEEKKRIDSIEHNLFLNMSNIKESFFKDLIWGGHPLDTAKTDKTEIITNLKFDRSSKLIQVMVIKIEDFKRLESVEWQGDRELLKFAISNVIEETLISYDEGDLFRNNLDEWIILFSFRDVSQSKINGKITEMFNSIAHDIFKCFHVPVTAGLSNICGSIDFLRQQYEQSRMAYEYSFVGGRGRLYRYSDLPKKEIDCLPQLLKQYNLLEQNLNPIDIKNISKISKSLCISDYLATPSNFENIKRYISNCFFILTDFVGKNPQLHSIKDELCKYDELIKNGGDLKQYNQLIQKVLIELENNSDFGYSIIDKIRRYISENYNQDISLNSLASHFDVSRGYLSRIFNIEMKCSITDYISKVRIQAALDLMKNTNLKLYEIAEKVGFKNNEHFSRTFKKVTGKTAREINNPKAKDC